MKHTKLLRLLAVITCLVLCLSLAGCGSLLQSLLGSEEMDDDAEITNPATVGGTDIVLPEDFERPVDNNRIAAVLDGDAYKGVIHMSSYRSTSYFFITGTSMTVTANFYLADANGENVTSERYNDVKVALWKKGDNSTTYIDTAHFLSNGTNQTFTFNNLEAGGEYRIAITYTDYAAYYVNGTFSVSPVSATGSEDETTATQE